MKATGRSGRWKMSLKISKKTATSIFLHFCSCRSAFSRFVSLSTAVSPSVSVATAVSDKGDSYNRGENRGISLTGRRLGVWEMMEKNFENEISHPF